MLSCVARRVGVDDFLTGVLRIGGPHVGNVGGVDLLAVGEHDDAHFAQRSGLASPRVGDQVDRALEGAGEIGEDESPQVVHEALELGDVPGCGARQVPVEARALQQHLVLRDDVHVVLPRKAGQKRADKLAGEQEVVLLDNVEHHDEVLRSVECTSGVPRPAARVVVIASPVIIRLQCARACQYRPRINTYL